MSARDERVERCPACGGCDQHPVDEVAGLSMCGACRLTFANPRPTLASLTAYYSTPAKYDAWLAEEPERDALWDRRVAIVNRHKKPGTLLDVGAGIGQFLARARPWFRGVSGTEISESAIRIATERYGLTMFAGALAAIDFRGATFDNVSLFHVLEHMHDPAGDLARCRDLLTEHGMIFIAVPNDLRSWELRVKTLLRRARGRLPAHVGPSGIPRLALDGSVDEIHLSQFTAGSLRRLMERCGFDPVALTLDPYFVRRGFRSLLHRTYYRAHQAVHRLSGVNGYNAILAIGRRR